MFVGDWYTCKEDTWCSDMFLVWWSSVDVRFDNGIRWRGRLVVFPYVSSGMKKMYCVLAEEEQGCGYRG